MLAALLHGAKGERARRVENTEGWSPRRGYCHANVDEWVRTHPGDRPVRGWLRVEYETAPNRVRFHSHSVVETLQGQLIDVTLSPSDPVHCFIRHPWSEEEFLAAVQNNGMPSIDHVLWPDDPAIMEAHLRLAAEPDAAIDGSQGGW